jgi:hypothetical protein
MQRGIRFMKQGTNPKGDLMEFQQESKHLLKGKNTHRNLANQIEHN